MVARRSHIGVGMLTSVIALATSSVTAIETGTVFTGASFTGVAGHRLGAGHRRATPSLTLVAIVKLALKLAAGVKVSAREQRVDVGDRAARRSTRRPA